MNPRARKRRAMTARPSFEGRGPLCSALLFAAVWDYLVVELVVQNSIEQSAGESKERDSRGVVVGMLMTGEVR